MYILFRNWTKTIIVAFFSVCVVLTRSALLSSIWCVSYRTSCKVKQPINYDIKPFVLLKHCYIFYHKTLRPNSKIKYFFRNMDKVYILRPIWSTFCTSIYQRRRDWCRNPLSSVYWILFFILVVNVFILSLKALLSVNIKVALFS